MKFATPGAACLLLLLAALVVRSTVAAAASQDQPRPNIVLIMSDDQGWGDLSLHGNTNLATPHVDSLARDGALFSYFYVSPVCAPTRASLLTGRYHPRTGVHGVSRGRERMNLGETTIAELLGRAGYVTAAFGKWHNGSQTTSAASSNNSTTSNSASARSSSTYRTTGPTRGVGTVA